MKTKRIIAFITMLVMSVTVISQCFVTAFAEDTVISTDGSAVGAETFIDDVEVSGTNSVGDLLASEFQEKQAEQLENNGYNIFSIEMDGNIATVDFQVQNTCTLIVGIYDDSKTTMFATGTTEVSEEDELVEVEIPLIIMPDYFYVKAYLVNSETLEPLCLEYTNPNYTQHMQEFFSKTTDDFDEEKVLNFDDDKTNNFAVYSDDVTVIPYEEGFNTNITYDEETSTYTIENASESVISLKSGDILIYSDDPDSDMIIAKIGSMSVSGTTVTITEADTSIEEVFEFVRIEEEAGMESAEAYANPEIADDEEEVLTLNNDGKKTASAEVDTETSGELKFEFSGEYSKDKNFTKSTGKKDKDGKDIKREVANLSANASIEGSASFKASISTKLYVSLSCTYFELKLPYEGNLHLKVSADVKFNVNFETLNFALLDGVVIIDITPQLNFELKADIEFDGKWWGSVGAHAELKDSKISIKNISESPQHKIENKMEGDIYIGLNLKPTIKLIHEKLASSKMSGDIGIKISQKRDNSFDSTKDYSKEPVCHDCTWCYDGDIFLCGRFYFNIEFLGHETKDKYLIGSKDSRAEKKIADYYWSVDRGEFKLTECPHKLYRMELGTYKNDDSKLGNVDITIDSPAPVGVITTGNNLEYISNLKTDDNGEAIVFMGLTDKKIVISYSKDGYKNTEGDFTFTLKNNVLTDKLSGTIRGRIEVALDPDSKATTTITTTTTTSTTTTTTSTTTVIKKPDDWKSAYKKTLNDYKSDKNIIDDTHGTGPKWDLQDFDNDGIPELLISVGPFHLASVIYYYYENGEAKPITDDNGKSIGGSYGLMSFCPQKNLLRLADVSMGYFYSSIYKFENKKFVKIFSSHDDSGAVGETKASYYVNDEKVTKEEYDAANSLYSSIDWISAGRKYDFDDFSALESNTVDTIGYSDYIEEDGSLYTLGDNGSGLLKNVATSLEQEKPIEILAEEPTETADDDYIFLEPAVHSLADLLPNAVYNYYVLYNNTDTETILNPGNIQYITQFTTDENGSAEINLGYSEITDEAVRMSVPVSPNETPIISQTVTLGDVNQDGMTDASDASQILGIYAVYSTGGTPTETEEQLLSADVNGDSMIDASDASTVLAYYAYLSTGGTVDIETFMST